MKIKNLGNLLGDLKPLLRTYLEDNGTKFTKTHFQCPNRKDHSNEDEQVACNFYPDEEHFKCFVCLESGDIFNACNLLEGRPTAGKGFITDNVLYLANKYNVKYELAEETVEEKKFNLAQKFLIKLVEEANQYLKTKKPKIAIDYIKKRKWEKVIDKHKLGYLPDNPKLKAFYNKFNQKTDILKSGVLNLEYNSLTNRLIYPIYNAYGLIVSISSRRLVNKDTIQKYHHHPIKVYKKPINLLYNLDKARKFSKIYIVEGASSVFTTTANKLESVISILGSNFSEKHYEWILKNGIKEMVFCFDGDEAGKNALNKAIILIQNKCEIKTFVKLLPKDKDPDDFIQEKGIKEFIKLKETSTFKYQLNKYIKTENVDSKNSLFEMLLSQSDSLVRERMLTLVVNETKLLKTTILEDLKKYEKKNQLLQGISIVDYLAEGEILAKEVDKFDEFRWKTNELIGLKTGFHFFDENMDGLQIGLHEVGGKWNVGKSSFILNLALNLLENENNYVLYFSIDDPSIFKTIPRAVSSSSKIDVNKVLKPRFGIERNETLTEEEKTSFTLAIEKAIKKIRGYSERFSLKDAKYGQDLNFILNNIKLCKQRALDLGNKNLIVFIDFLHMVKVSSREETEKLIKIVESLKIASTIYEAPIVTTVMSTKSGAQQKHFQDDSIKGAVELQYAADSICLLETDFYDDRGQMYFYDDEGLARPIISVNVTKNKLSGFKGKIFFRFFSEQLRFVECDDDEQLKYKKQIH